MKRNGGFRKIRYFATLGLSTVALAIASLSTFAWFQINATSTDPNNTFSAGSSDFSIQSVDGLKSVRQIDASGYQTVSGDERSISRQSATAASTSNTGNTTKETDFDVPEQGVGYYVVFSSSDYKYEGAYKMETNDDLQNNSDKLTLKNVPLTANTFFDIRRHYFKSDTNMADEYVTEISSASSGSSTAIHTTRQTDADHGNQSHWKVKVTGNYDIYVSSTNQLHVVGVSSFSEQVNADSVKEEVALETPKGAQTKNKPPKRMASKSNLAQSGFSDYTVTVENCSGEWWWQVWNGSADYTLKEWTNGNWTKTFTDSTSPTKSQVFTGGTIWIKKRPGSGDPYNTYEINTAGKNYIAINNPGSNSGFYAQTKSVLTIRYVNASGTSIKTADSITCWNEDAISASSGWSSKGKPHISGYSFLGWYTAATSGSPADVDGYISANATVYARYTANTTRTFYIDSAALSIGAYTPYMHYWNDDGTGASDVEGVLVDSSKSTRYWSFTTPSISTDGLSFLFRYNNYTWQTNNIAYSSAKNFYVPNGTSSRDPDYSFSSSGTLHKLTYYKKKGTNTKEAINTSGYSQYVLDGYEFQIATIPASDTGYSTKPSVWKSAENGGGTSYTPGNRYAITGNLDLYAIYTGLTYTVTLSAGSGLSNTPTTSVTARYGEPMPSATMPTKTGYTFNGYYYSGTKYYNSDGSSATRWNRTSATTLTASWTANSYTVTLYPNSGTVADGHDVTGYTYGVGATLPTSTYITRDDYIFAGWYDNSSFTGSRYTEISTTDLGNKEFYAKWVQETEITFDQQGPTTSGTSSVVATKGEAMPTLSTKPAKTGYTFDGYWTGTGGTGTKYYNADKSSARNWDQVVAETTLYAKWTKDAKITLDNQSATTAGASEVAAGHVYNTNLPSIAGNLPAKTGYTFGGYFTGTGGTGNQYYNADGTATAKWTEAGSVSTLYAKWTPITYSVAFNKNESSATGSMSNEGFTYDVSKALTSNGFSWTGHHFVGWATASDGDVVYTNGQSVSNLSSTNGATVNLFAKWEVNTYEVAFNANGGTGSIANESFTWGVSKALTTNATQITRTGYTFAGWNTQADGKGTSYSNGQSVTSLTNEHEGVVTLYAKWTAITYQVRFNGNGATSGSMSNESFTYGTAKNLTSNGFSKTGYTFAGWATSAGGDVVYSNAESVSNLASTQGAVVDLYAKWTANNYTVTFDKQSGTGGSNSVSATYDSAMPSASAPTRSGYTFAGYYDAIGGGGKCYYDKDMVSQRNWDKTSATTLYAKWTATVTLNAEDATTAYSQTTTGVYNAVLSANVAVPVRTGYNFLGFYDAEEGGNQYYDQYGHPTSRVWTTQTTLYAHWALKTTTVSFNDNGGSGGQSGTVTATWSQDMPAITNRPVRDGYVFLGYYDGTGDGAVQYYNAFGASARTWDKESATCTLYAKWRAVSSGGTFYLIQDNLGSSDTLYAYFWGSDFVYFAEINTKATNYNNVYQVNYPSGTNYMLFYRGTTKGVINTSCQTNDIRITGTAEQTKDSFNYAKGSNNLIYVHSTKSSGSNQWEWNTFYSAPANVGYYLSGVGNGWENQMNHVAVPGGFANLTQFETTSVNYEFQIWGYDEDHNWVIYETAKTGGSSVSATGTTCPNAIRIPSVGVWDITAANNGETFNGVYVYGSNYATLNFSILGGETYTGDSLLAGAGLAEDFPHNDGSIGANSYSATQNKYYYDASIEVKVGDRFTISTRNGSTGSVNANITIASGDTATFISRPEGKNYYQVLTAGRYTVYLTYDDKIVMAPVPEYGNGYYIMPSNTAKTLYTGFDGGVKMVTNSVAGGAYFTGYYSNGSQINFSDGTTSSPNANVVFFRSYVDGVDTHYTTINIDSRVSSDVAYVDSNGIVRLKTGYYNIRISGSTVYISAYTVSDSFSLDPLVSKKTVANNYTSIVYEIEYRLSTTGVPVTMSCEALSIGSQLDWAFYAPAERITSYTNSGGVLREDNSTAPYYVMRERYFDDVFGSGSPVRVESDEITASSTEESFYCYIIVDYKDGLSTLPLINTTTANFRITCTQVVPEVSSSVSSIQIQVAPWRKETNQ